MNGISACSFFDVAFVLTVDGVFLRILISFFPCFALCLFLFIFSDLVTEPLWTGKQLFSLLLPKMINLNRDSQNHDKTDSRNFPQGDTVVHIERGELLMVCRFVVKKNICAICHCSGICAKAKVVCVFVFIPLYRMMCLQTTRNCAKYHLSGLLSLLNSFPFVILFLCRCTPLVPLVSLSASFCAQGIVDKPSLGQSSGSLIHIIWLEAGPEAAKLFMSGTQVRNAVWKRVDQQRQPHIP